MLLSSHSSNGQKLKHILIATLYEQKNFGGRKWEVTSTFPNSECLTLVGFGEPNGRITSINTHGYCVILYEGYNCDGSRIIVHPQTPCHNNLSMCGLSFNDRARSLKLCGKNAQ